MARSARTCAPLLLLLACTHSSGGEESAFAGRTTTGGESPETMSSPLTGGTSTGAGTSATSPTGVTGATIGPRAKYELGGETADAGTGTPNPTCQVVHNLNAVGDCHEAAPPDAFEPVTQWDFLAPEGFQESIVIPLVANMTDDNGDGWIDLCDVPDVVVVAGTSGGDALPARIYILDGATGVPHFDSGAELVSWGTTPALGDIDADGVVEIVTARPGADPRLVAFENDGTLKWGSDPDTGTWHGAQGDVEGTLEILSGLGLTMRAGNRTGSWNNLWTPPNPR